MTMIAMTPKSCHAALQLTLVTSVDSADIAHEWLKTSEGIHPFLIFTSGHAHALKQRVDDPRQFIVDVLLVLAKIDVTDSADTKI